MTKERHKTGIAIIASSLLFIIAVLLIIISNIIAQKQRKEFIQIPIQDTCIKIPLTIDTLNASFYNPEEQQTDKSPLITASGYKINNPSQDRIIALSRDLLRQYGGKYAFGDTVFVYGCKQLWGTWVIQDKMGKTRKNIEITKSIDFCINYKPFPFCSKVIVVRFRDGKIQE